MRVIVFFFLLIPPTMMMQIWEACVALAWRESTVTTRSIDFFTRSSYSTSIAIWGRTKNGSWFNGWLVGLVHGWLCFVHLAFLNNLNVVAHQ
jgi:hypothetical protein